MSTPSTRSDNATSDHRGELIEATLDAAWMYHVEILLVGLVVAGWLELARQVGEIAAGVVVGIGLTMLLLVAPSRRVLVELLVRAQWRRRVERALSRLAHDCFGDRAPTVGRVRRTPAGVTVALRLQAGHAMTQLERAAERLATALRVRGVRVERNINDASRCALIVITTDLFGRGSLRPPWAEASTLDFWGPIEIGVDEAGGKVSLRLVERNLLVGGATGFGKSNLLQEIAAAAALDPNTTLWILDPKMVVLTRWAPVAADSAGADITAAIRVLSLLFEEMRRRYDVLTPTGLRTIRQGGAMGRHVLICDEVGIYLQDDDKSATAQFSALLQKIVTLGRAAGIVTVLATQKPTTDIISSKIRENLVYRAAFRCATREHSESILGSGFAAAGYVATDIDPDQPGVCYLVADGKEPMKLRCFYLADEDLDAIVERAKVLWR